MCSARELELGEDHSGIIELAEDAPVGATFAAYAGLDDPVFDVNVTPNRQDCMGVRGIARDLAAAGMGTLKPLAVPQIQGSFACPIEIRIDDSEGCPAFFGRVVRGVRNGSSRSWLQQRLKANGIKMEIALEPPAVFFGQSTVQGAYDMALWAWSSGIDPSQISMFTCDSIPSKANEYSGQNNYRYCNEHVSKLLEKSDVTTAVAERAKMLGDTPAHRQLWRRLDRIADVFWRDDAKTRFAVWLMDGATREDAIVFKVNANWDVVARGDALLSPDVTRSVIQRSVSGPDAAPRASARPQPEVGLTEREAEVLTLVARGWSNAEIASSLFLGEATVKTHVSKVLQKLGVRDRVQAVVFAYEHGLVSPTP